MGVIGDTAEDYGYLNLAFNSFLLGDASVHDAIRIEAGRVQRLASGKFQPNRRGFCVATALFHGNRGIISLFDGALMRLWTRDFPVVGATLQPVLFDASGAEYMFLSAIRPAQGYQGGLLNGAGELAVPLPDDDGPALCAFPYDLDGDGLEELLTWDHERLWIYHSNADCVTGPATLFRLAFRHPPLPLKSSEHALRSGKKALNRYA